MNLHRVIRSGRKRINTKPKQKRPLPKKQAHTSMPIHRYGYRGQNAFFGSTAPDVSAGFLALDSSLRRAFSPYGNGCCGQLLDHSDRIARDLHPIPFYLGFRQALNTLLGTDFILERFKCRCQVPGAQYVTGIFLCCLGSVHRKNEQGYRCLTLYYHVAYNNINCIALSECPIRGQRELGASPKRSGHCKRGVEL